MSSRALSIFSITAASCLCFSAHAAIIEIINPSFELTSRPLLVGEQTNGMNGVGTPVATCFPFESGVPSWDNPVEVPGWRTFFQPQPSLATIRAGVLNPPTIVGQPFIQGQHGQNVFVNQNSKAGQALNHIIQPNTTYRLDFLGGIGRFDSDYFFAVSFITVPTLDTLPLDGAFQVDARRVAISGTLNHPPDAAGQMLPYFFEYTTPAVIPPEHAGRFLGITLFGSDGIPRVVLDDFRLEATPVPGPASTCLLLLCSLAARRRLR
jgi:hypothetical protein